MTMADVHHITAPEGFTAAGVTAGLKASGRHDLMVLAADCPAAAAIVTTRNQVVGAPILWCRQLLPRGHGRIRALVVNAGCSNVCTGPAGLRDAATMAGDVAKQLDCPAEQVLVGSTGVIGHRLPMDRIRAGIADACRTLGRDRDDHAAQAILTTDTRPKSAVVRGRLGGKTVTVAGIAKGSGMIAPSLATMFGFLTTDAAASPAALRKALRAACKTSFNAVTVDSDTSTSDMVTLMASGAAGNPRVTGSSKDFYRLADLVGEVCTKLARAIAADGEGATALVEVRVTGARSDREAATAAKAVADSPLVKTAVHGRDPNWGRIVMALGKSAAKVDADRLTVRIGKTTVFANGTGRRFDPARVVEHLSGDEVVLTADLGLGTGRYTALTCDLSREYITINADYHT
jgi:glutamate N-acetyltransferase/amino-acid N-acetyltransferase